jgi:hypothetical protein
MLTKRMVPSLSDLSSFLSGYWCSMIDNCPGEGNADRLYDFFQDNFKRYYESNRAPFGLYFHTM